MDSSRTDDVLCALENTADGAFAVDQQQRIVAWNARAKGILGYESSEALGRFCYDLIETDRYCSEGSCGLCSDAKCEYACDVVRIARRGEPAPTHTRLTRSKGGTPRLLSLTHLPVAAGPDNAKLVILHLFRDVGRDRRTQLLTDNLLGHIRAMTAILDEFSGPVPPKYAPRPEPALTGRQQEVLALLAKGFRTHAIAEYLEINTSTVRNHIQKLFEKLGVHTRTQAVIAGLEMGLITK